MDEFGTSIKLKENINKFLNGPEGLTFFKTMQSIELISWNIKQLESYLKLYEYNTTNLLSCMALDIDHFHAADYFKQLSITYYKFARTFRSNINKKLQKDSGMPYF